MGGVDRQFSLEFATMRSLLAAILLISPALAFAQEKPVEDGTVQGQAPQRIRNLLLRTGEKCPPSTDTEIVVCSSIEEPYRIPRRLRETEPTAANRTWASRVEGADDVSRKASGLPNSCSPTGTGGQTGCTKALIDQWNAERRAQASGNPIP